MRLEKTHFSHEGIKQVTEKLEGFLPIAAVSFSGVSSRGGELTDVFYFSLADEG
jgi:hypothetical protein